jgi:hypothetical protein
MSLIFYLKSNWNKLDEEISPPSGYPLISKFYIKKQIQNNPSHALQNDKIKFKLIFETRSGVGIKPG